MRPIATINALCTAYNTPFGPPAFGVIYGRIINGSTNHFANNRPIAHVSSSIAYSGFAIVFGKIQYVSWTGRVVSGANKVFTNSKAVAVLGSQTDASGQVIEGHGNIMCS